MTVVRCSDEEAPRKRTSADAGVGHGAAPASVNSDEPNSSSAATGSAGSTVSDGEAPCERTSAVALAGVGSAGTTSADSDEPQSSSVATGSEEPLRKKPRLTRKQRVARIAAAVTNILECLDEEPGRQGLQKTPERYANALLELTSGYTMSAAQVVGDAHFAERESEFVLVRDIAVHSLCEHHLLPFHGACHIAYVPGRNVLGLSKLARIVEVFARRLQVQERLTNQVADAVQEATGAQGVMVFISCKHMCMSMRGVNKVGSATVTTAARGRYVRDTVLRAEFFHTIRCG